MIQPIELSSIEQPMHMSASDIPFKHREVVDLVVNEQDRMSPRTFTKVRIKMEISLYTYPHNR